MTMRFGLVMVMVPINMKYNKMIDSEPKKKVMEIDFSRDKFRANCNGHSR